MTAGVSTVSRRVASGGLRSAVAREVNAAFAIAWREILRAIKSPVSLAFAAAFPMIFMGILGGSISQNLGAGLPYAYLPFMLIGMTGFTMYQGCNKTQARCSQLGNLLNNGSEPYVPNPEVAV